MRFGLVALFCAVFFIGPFTSAQAQTQDPFAQLREAYANKDAAGAASAYAADGVVIYAYEGSPEERVAGAAAIAASFQTFFDQFGADQPLDLNFRILRRSTDAAEGIYRLRFGESVSYGRFEVTFADGRFATDRSSNASAADFEQAPGPVLLADEH